MFCYETGGQSVFIGSRGDAGFDPLRCNANRSYMKHYHNLIVLTLISNSGTLLEKHQASKELDICRRKMKFWERQPHFCKETAKVEIERINRTAKVV